MQTRFFIIKSYNDLIYLTIFSTSWRKQKRLFSFSNIIFFIKCEKHDCTIISSGESIFLKNGVLCVQINFTTFLAWWVLLGNLSVSRSSRSGMESQLSKLRDVSNYTNRRSFNYYDKWPLHRKRTSQDLFYNH